MKMERVAKNLFLGTGLVLGLGVAMTPLTTHAAIITETGDLGTTREVQTDNTNAGYTLCYEDRPSIDAEGNQKMPTVPCERGMQVAFNVQPTITIDALAYPGQEATKDPSSTDEETQFYANAPIVLSPTVIREGTISTTVIANTKYSLSVKADQGITTMQHVSNENGLIPTTNNLQDGVAGWGIKVPGSGTEEGDGQYVAVPGIDENGVEQPPYKYFTSTTTGPVTGQTHDLVIGIAASPDLPAGIYQATVVITATAGV